MGRCSWALFAICVMISSATGVPSNAAELKLFSAVAVRPAILDLIPRFEQATGHKIVAMFDVNPGVKKQVESGERFDVVIVNPEMVEDLAKQGKVVAGSQLNFGRAGMGVAVRGGAPKPDLSSVEAFKRTLLNAKSVAYAGEGSSGAHFLALLTRLGIADEMGSKLKSVAGGQTGQVVARGDAELGVVPVTTILAAAPGAELAGLFPTELQSFIDFAIGLSASTSDPEASNALIRFLAAPESDALLRSKGLERSK